MNLTLLTIFILIHFVYAQLGSYIQRDKPETFCGMRLANAIEIVCSKRFTRAKRSIDYSSSLRNIIISSTSSKKVLSHENGDGKSLRVRRGIVESCCTHPCDYDELISYC